MAFDIDTFAETSTSVAWGDLDLDAFREHPLPEASLRALRYMCDVEYHTVCYLRDMLVTPSHNDGEVSTFMTMWNREEYWHGEALAAVLRVHGVTVEYDQLKATRLKLGWRDRLDPIKQSLMGNLIGKDFVATHMSWGAANERSAAAAYRRLARLGHQAARGERQGPQVHPLRALEVLGPRRLDRDAGGGDPVRHGLPVRRRGRPARGPQDGRRHRQAPRHDGPLDRRGRVPHARDVRHRLTR
jgi:hypothetical protein